MLPAALAYALLALLPLGGDDRDLVELTNGKEIACRVVLEQKDRVIVRLGSVEKTINKDDIAKIESVARAHRDVHEAFGKMRNETPDALLVLAETCREKRLPHTERLLYYRIVAAHPDHEVANERLGHARRQDSWLIPGRGGNLPLAKADEVRRDWGKAWEIRSEHWSARSSCTLADTVTSLFELEFLYLKFLDLLQQELELREVLEPMRVNLYGDPDQFPGLGSTVGAVFRPDENALYTLQYTPGERPHGLFHEGTHELLHNTVVDVAHSRGSLPGWLDEGLADYMESALASGERPRPSFRPAEPCVESLAAIATARRPYDLHRVLNFRADDFAASSKQDLKYAQSYALVHLMLHGTGEKTREQFFDYLRAAVGGKGQASTFRRMFRPIWSRLEREYLDYARGR